MSNKLKCECSYINLIKNRDSHLNINNNSKRPENKLKKYVSSLSRLVTKAINSNEFDSRNKRKLKKLQREIIHLDSKCSKINVRNSNISTSSSSVFQSISNSSKSETSIKLESSSNDSNDRNKNDQNKIIKCLYKLINKLTGKVSNGNTVVKDNKNKHISRRNLKNTVSASSNSDSEVSDENYLNKLTFDITKDRHKKFVHDQKPKFYQSKEIDLRNNNKYKMLITQNIKKDDNCFQKLPGIGSVYELKLKRYVRNINQLLEASRVMRKNDFKALMKYYADMNSYQSERLYLALVDYSRRKN